MSKIKDVCTNCNHITIYNWRDYIKKFVIFTLVSFGILFIIYIIIMSPIYILNIFAGKLMLNSIAPNTQELRQIAMNYTTYSGYDSFAFADDLMTNLPRIRYAHPSKFKLMGDYKDTLNYAGDCKQDSVLFAGMMLASGYDAYVSCSIQHNHCVAVVPENKKFYNISDRHKLVVDLTGNFATIYNINVDFWKYPNNYEEIINYN